MRRRWTCISAVFVISFCSLSTLQAQAGDKAKVVASCPARPGKKLLTVHVFVLPAHREIEGTGDDDGTEWLLDKEPLKPGEHAVLDCGYGAPRARPDAAVAPGDHVTVPVPATAVSCWSSNTPVDGICSRK